jgi:hypothetical protein
MPFVALPDEVLAAVFAEGLEAMMKQRRELLDERHFLCARLDLSPDVSSAKLLDAASDVVNLLMAARDVLGFPQIRRRPMELRGVAADVQRRQVEASQQLVTESLAWTLHRLMGWS